MSLLREVMAELSGMFIGDARLALGVLALVGGTAALVDLAGVPPAIGAALLAFGCPLLLIHNVHRRARGAGG